MERTSCIEISKVHSNAGARSFAVLNMHPILAANILLTSSGGGRSPQTLLKRQSAKALWSYTVKLADFGVSGQLSATMTKKVRVSWHLDSWL